jgi:catechol 2,3-dioxygenase-like lactoylglutathione lyase family enzyme
MTIAIDRFDHIVLNVKDVEASAAWYTEVLGMQREDFASRTGTRVAMRFGRQKINLRPVDSDAVGWFTGAHPAAGGTRRHAADPTAAAVGASPGDPPAGRSAVPPALVGSRR